MAFPNPAFNELNIRIASEHDILVNPTLEIVNMQGRLIRKIVSSGAEDKNFKYFKTSVRGLAPGSYTVWYKEGIKNYTKKIAVLSND